MNTTFLNEFTRDAAMTIFEVIAGIDLENSLDDRYEVLLEKLKENQKICGYTVEETVKSLLMRERNPYDNFPDEIPHAITTIIKSGEFFSVIPKLVSHVWPRKSRSFFIHIPKTAGNSVMTVIRKSSGIEPWNALYNHEIFRLDGIEKCAQLRFISDHYHRPGASIWYVGHYYFGSVVDEKFVVKGDSVFTVTRQPIDVVISQFNFMLTVANDSNAGGVREAWRKWIGGCVRDWNGNVDSLTIADYSNLLMSDYFKRHHSNQICRYISNDTGGVSEAAALVYEYDIDVVNISELSIYSKKKLGVEMPVERKNSSIKYLYSLSELPLDVRVFVVNELVNRDLLFYELMASK